MITQTGKHALRAVLELALLPAGEYLGAAALADRTGAPANYLGKLLQSLAGAGVLQSRKGPGGGFRLARPPSETSLMEIVSPITDLAQWEGCILGLPICSEETACALHLEWGALRERYMSLLSGTRLSDLVGSQSSRPEAGTILGGIPPEKGSR